jgi:hypothetical protein
LKANFGHIVLPQAFIQPLILIVISRLLLYCGYSIVKTRSNSTAIPVLLAIPKLHVSVPGQAVYQNRVVA